MKENYETSSRSERIENPRGSIHATIATYHMLSYTTAYTTAQLR